MMATTQPEDIPQTIRSRCQHFSFRAVKFEDIMGQLRDIVTQEKIPADDDALALLAEAGDGSLRDALSILDQAIASTSDHLTLDSVRSLIGAAPATALEMVMLAVAESSSDKILVLVNELIGEGHSPTHFARQLVRFLRNVTVAKIAGKDSGLLQVSSDERARVSRIAELFSEEDLTRHLQIMLRTHGELGYRQEQRFHLELGLLKMAHAQRLLPIEQLLSDAAASAAGSARTTPRPVLGPPPHSYALPAEARRSEPPTSARPNSVSPFAADSARKGTPKAESSGATSGSNANLVIMGSAAPAVEELSPAPDPQPSEHAEVKANIRTEVNAEAKTESRPEANAESLRDAVLHALANQQMLVSLLENAEWRLEGNGLIAKVAASNTMIEMSFTNEARRIAAAAASGLAGRPIKMLVEPGGAPQPVSAARRASSKLSGTARSRAEQDPVVQRMQEKFGAEIRTVIDYREKG
jgi:DNA polymerase III subunit gamma/tau